MTYKVNGVELACPRCRTMNGEVFVHKYFVQSQVELGREQIESIIANVQADYDFLNKIHYPPDGYVLSDEEFRGTLIAFRTIGDKIHIDLYLQAELAYLAHLRGLIAEVSQC